MIEEEMLRVLRKDGCLATRMRRCKRRRKKLKINTRRRNNWKDSRN